MAAWHLQRDMLVFPGLRVRLHRIGLAHWQPGTRLRSWGVAPLHRHGDSLWVPCAEDEALWLGAWLDDDGGAATVHLRDAASTLTATIALPRDFQLTGLCDADGRAQALAQPPCQWQLAVHSAGVQVGLTLALHLPAAWAQLAGRAAPAALTGPPPLPPRLP